MHILEDNQNILAFEKFSSADRLFWQQDKYRRILKEKEAYWNNKMAVFDNKVYHHTTVPTCDSSKDLAWLKFFQRPFCNEVCCILTKVAQTLTTRSGFLLNMHIVQLVKQMAYTIGLEDIMQDIHCVTLSHL